MKIPKSHVFPMFLELFSRHYIMRTMFPIQNNRYTQRQGLVADPAALRYYAIIERLHSFCLYEPLWMHNNRPDPLALHQATINRTTSTP